MDEDRISLIQYCEKKEPIFHCQINQKDYSFSTIYLMQYVFHQKEIISPYEAYALWKFLCIKNLIYFYNFSKEEILYMEKLSEFQICDFQFLTQDFSKDLKVIDFDIPMINLLNTSVNEVVINQIVDKIPKEDDLLNKVLWVYFYLCENFCYDLSYAMSKPGENSFLNHWYGDFIKHIDFENNELICLEFSILFATILEKLQVPYRFSKHELKVGKHIYLLVNVGKYILSFDSTSRILCFDFYHVKSKQTPIGIVCLNENQQTKKDFSKIFLEFQKKYFHKEVISNINNSIEKEQDPELKRFSKIFSLFQYFLSKTFFKRYDYFCYVMNLAYLFFYPKYSLEVYFGRRNQNGKSYPILILILSGKYTHYIYEIREGEKARRLHSFDFLYQKNRKNIEIFNGQVFPKEAYENDIGRTQI